MRTPIVTPGSLVASVAGLAVCLTAEPAAALSIAPIASAAEAQTALVDALVTPGSGITIVPSSISYQGTHGAALRQAALYSGFALAPSSGSTPTLSLPDGILLTSGNAAVPLTNSLERFNGVSRSGANAALSALSGGDTADANMLTFRFNVPAGRTSVSAQFVFGTEEFPLQNVTDIFGFFIDGVNFARFSNGDLISNTPGNPTNFIANPVGSGLYGIEYNGLTRSLTVVGLLGVAGADGSHAFSVGVADTSDPIFDSGVFVSPLVLGTASEGGIVDVPAIPEPGTFGLMLAGLAAGGAFLRGRRPPPRARAA
jgi:hypothetical protein